MLCVVVSQKQIVLCAVVDCFKAIPWVKASFAWPCCWSCGVSVTHLIHWSSEDRAVPFVISETYSEKSSDCRQTSAVSSSLWKCSVKCRTIWGPGYSCCGFETFHKNCMQCGKSSAAFTPLIVLRACLWAWLKHGEYSKNVRSARACIEVL